MSREVVYWLMSIKADGLSLLAYDDGKGIALMSLDGALYELTYADIEACYSVAPDRLIQRFKHVGRLLSGLSVKAPDPIRLPLHSLPPTLSPTVAAVKRFGICFPGGWRCRNGAYACSGLRFITRRPGSDRWQQPVAQN